MRLNRYNIPIRILAIALICISLITFSCKQKPDTAVQDQQCETFYTKMLKRLTTGEFPDGRSYVDKLDSFYRASNVSSPECMAKLYANKGNFYYNIEKYDSGLIYADSYITVVEQNEHLANYIYDYTDASNLKGKLLYMSGHYNQAYNYYFKSKKIGDLQADSSIREGYNSGLAFISYKQKKYRQAAGYFKQAYKYCSYNKSPYKYSMQEYLDDVALSYERANMYDSAIYFYDSTFRFINTNKAQFSPVMTAKAIAVVNGNMGGVFLYQGKIDTAITLLKNSVAVNMQPYYDNKDALLTHIKLASAYLVKNDLVLLFSTLADIRKELDTISHPLTAESDWRKLMYLYYDQTGNSGMAFKYYRTFASLRDSLWQTEKNQLQNDVNRDLTENEQSHRIDLLQKQNQVDNLYLAVTVGLSVLAVVIIILVYVNYNRSKKNVIALTLLNARIEEQKKQLEHTTNELLKSNSDKDRILHAVAHDLRNPISASMMLSTLMLEEEKNESDKESLQMIVSASENSLSLIGELLELSGNQKQDSSMPKEILDITESVNYATGLLRFKANEKNQTIDFSNPGRPLYVHANKEKMNRVFGNIIANAIKFSPANSGIDVLMTEKNDHVLIEVKDNGIGIPANMLPLIFNTFTTAKRYGTSGETSFGLGLSICKQIVEAHGGRIWAKSTEGKGSSFFIELPLI